MNIRLVKTVGYNKVLQPVLNILDTLIPYSNTRNKYLYGYYLYLIDKTLCKLNNYQLLTIFKTQFRLRFFYFYK